MHLDLLKDLPARLLIITTALTFTLALLQYLRLGPVLIEAGSAALSLLPAAALAVPALLTITLPASLLVASLITFRQLSTSGQWLACRQCGGGLGALARGQLLCGGLVAVLTGLCAFGLAPAGLERLGQTMARLHLEGRLAQSGGEPVLFDQGRLALAARQVAVRDDGVVELEGLWMARRGARRVTLTRAARGSWDGQRLVLEQAEVLDQALREGGGAAVRSSHERATVVLSVEEQGALEGDRARWLRYVPLTEQLSTAKLWAIASGERRQGGVSARRAAVACLKRLVLTLSPVGLMLLAFALSGPASLEPRGSSFSAPVVVAVAVGGGYYAALRGGEVLAQGGGALAWVVALPVGLVGAVIGAGWWRLARRW